VNSFADVTLPRAGGAPTGVVLEALAAVQSLLANGATVLFVISRSVKQSTKKQFETMLTELLTLCVSVKKRHPRRDDAKLTYEAPRHHYFRTIFHTGRKRSESVRRKK
jgi:hypothetical protein